MTNEIKKCKDCNIVLDDYTSCLYAWTTPLDQGPAQKRFNDTHKEICCDCMDEMHGMPPEKRVFLRPSGEPEGNG